VTPEPPHASSWAAPPEFYIDENMAGRTVRRFIADLGYVVHTPAEVFGRELLDHGLDDEDWLPVVGANGWAVFGRDQRILEREMEFQAYRNAKIHMFLLPGHAPLAEILHLLAVNLADLCARTSARRPNVYWLTRGGIEDYEQRVAKRAKRRR
jgi:hypothetical protein